MRICIFDNVRIRARWIGPYAWRNVRPPFRGCFVGISLVFATLWQTVRSCRGRFIVPAYMKTPTKWRTEMCVRWCKYTYLIMWKHIFGYGNTRFCLCQDTGTMNRPLRLTVCSLRISRIVRWHFAECSPRNRKPFVTYFVCVRCAFVGWIWCICKIKNLEKNLTYQFFCLSLQYIRISLLRLLAVQ